MKLVAIADIHSQYEAVMSNLPEGDVLIIAGDMTRRGKLGDLRNFCVWLKKIRKNYGHVLIVAGNHDHCFEREHEKPIAIKMVEDAGGIYLEDEEIIIDGIKFYGSPWSPKFHNWAFYLTRRSKELSDIWDKIPDDTKVLITHCPPYKCHDMTIRKENVGCEILARRVLYLDDLLFHGFGHIHEDAGSTYIFHNVSAIDENYVYKNKAVVVEI